MGAPTTSSSPTPSRDASQSSSRRRTGASTADRTQRRPRRLTGFRAGLAGFLTARVVVARAGLRGAALAGVRAGALAGLRAAVVLRVVDAGRPCGALAGLRAAGLVALRPGAFAAGL